MKRDDLHLQFEPTECGIIALAAITALLLKPICPWYLKDRYGVSSRGLKLSQILQILREHGFTAQAALATPESLIGQERPVIALWRGNHFVVVEKVGKRYADVFDPELGWRQISLNSLARCLTGPIVEIVSLPSESPPARLRKGGVKFWIASTKVRSSFIALLVFAVALQLMVLAGPLIAQRIVDSASHEATSSLASAIGLYATLSIAIIAVRTLMQRLAIRMSATMSRRMLLSAVRLLFGKPMSYFLRHSPQIIAAKVLGLNSIRTFVLRFVSTTLIQGASGVLALAMLFYIQPMFGAIVAAARALSIVLDRRMALRLSSVGDERFRANASQMRLLTEMSRCGATIKVNGAVEHVTRRFRRESVIASAAEASHDSMKQTRSDGLSLVTTIEQIAVLAGAAWMLGVGALTVGAFVAINMYRDICNLGFRELQDGYSELLNVRRATRRLEDLSEPSVDRNDLNKCDGSGGAFSVDVRNVAFKYSEFDPEVFSGLNLTIAPGECVAIVGPSGSGKTTLGHLLTGSLEPTSGQVFVDGKHVLRGSENVLPSIGTVMQSDSLMTGTIRENISFFRKLTDAEIQQAASTASIHDFICSLPMRYETLVSDEFGGLSGGQRQRILIARAIAGLPSLLIMDEATSFLDERTEKEISSRIANMSMTRIIFAHRQETIRQASRVIDIRALSDASEMMDFEEKMNA